MNNSSDLMDTFFAQPNLKNIKSRFVAISWILIVVVIVFIVLLTKNSYDFLKALAIFVLIFLAIYNLYSAMKIPNFGVIENKT